MLFVPLPFVVTLLLVIVLFTLLRGQDRIGANKPFLALIALCAMQSAVVGLRWGYGVTALRFVLPVLAACLPPLVLASFRSLMRDDDPGALGLRALVHAVPPVLIAALIIAWPETIDAALVALFVGYAAAVLNLGRSGPDALGKARFDGTLPAYRALWVAAAALCVSALFDLVVLIDFEWAKGANVPAMVGNANLLGLLLIGLTASVAGRSQAAPEAGLALESRPAPDGKPEPVQSPASAGDRDILIRVEGLMRNEGLFRDENLNLARLARRAGIPARQISGAINRLAGTNVSQYVNDRRIAEACRLLRDTGHTVTVVMLESGFQTKSNFNREFRRVTGLSPVAWREQNGPAGIRDADEPRGCYGP